MTPTPEGDFTNNSAVYHRVSKADLLENIVDTENWALWDDTTGWVRNYPMHVDETGYWEDPYLYAWDQEDWENGSPFFRGETAVNEFRQLKPGEFSLDQNYPNPFNQVTNIRFNLESKASIKLAVYDLLGREVAVLLHKSISSGNHSALFDAGELASGMYFVKLTSGVNNKIRKIVLFK
ncbi:MAG: T9SS type A sorting domain-containing protein [Candidatus Electryonea clarkiae]|nr:T9SS type A sorting domain-containing protein [Candidatus Electryonea clarkiae]MDP8288680.1 T9SS type A sorting domain-containing protein [Candidatus Electryonea clarkiae]